MSNGADEIIVALYDYVAKEPEELSIRKNEQLTLIDAKFTWWQVRNGGGKVGLVPSNFLRRDKAKGESLVNRIANRLPGGKKGKISSTGGSGVPPTGGGGKATMFPSAVAAPTPVASNQLNEEYISKFNYDALKDDELSLTKGMKVLVLKMEEDGWWYGKDADRPGNPGWFPSNYVAKNNQNHTEPPPAPKPQTNGCLMVARCLYPFNTENQEELRFEQDELLDIVEEPPDDPEWWLARNSEGLIGLVPKNYVEAVPDAQPRYDAVTPKAEVVIPSSNVEVSNWTSVEDKDWFFGSLRRAEAERLLSERAKNGEFLVRNSETSPGEFSISMKMPQRMRHFKVVVLPDGQYGIGQRRFESIDVLLAHYKKAPIFTNQEQGKFYLTNPVPR